MWRDHESGMKRELPVLALNRQQAAEALGISVGLFDQHVKEGRIPCVRVGKRPLFPVEALRDWLYREASRADGPPET